MSGDILIVTSSIDLTCDYIINKFNDIKFYRFNVDRIQEYEIVVSDCGVMIESQNWGCNLGEVRAIYYRKPKLPNYFGIFDEKYHGFAHKELFSFVEGIVESFSGVCLSKPSLLRRANNKILQCLLAKDIGFKMPRPAITNSAKFAFVGLDKKIVKPISIGTIEHQSQKTIVQTNLVDECRSAEYLKWCPAYFQSYVDKDYEVRVTCIGDDIFPVKIKSKDNIDWRRLGNDVSYEITDIPQPLISGINKMMNELGLRFGCFDFLVKDGEFLFLEVNANGQWAWLERALNLDISGSIINELIGYE